MSRIRRWAYEFVSGDLEGVTYSSIRAGLIEFRRRVEQLQYNMVVHQFCRPVWERYVAVRVRIVPGVQRGDPPLSALGAASAMAR